MIFCSWNFFISRRGIHVSGREIHVSRLEIHISRPEIKKQQGKKRKTLREGENNSRDLSPWVWLSHWWQDTLKITGKGYWSFILRIIFLLTDASFVITSPWYPPPGCPRTPWKEFSGCKVSEFKRRSASLLIEPKRFFANIRCFSCHFATAIFCKLSSRTGSPLLVCSQGGTRAVPPWD